MGRNAFKTSGGYTMTSEGTRYFGKRFRVYTEGRAAIKRPIVKPSWLPKAVLPGI